MELLYFVILAGVFITTSNADCGCSIANRAKKYIREEDKSCAVSADDQRDAEETMVFIKGRNFTIGTDKPEIVADGESPSRTVYMDDYFIDKYEVSNSDFGRFVDETGHKTEAELFGDSFVFQLFLSKTTLKSITQAVKDAPWWVPVKGANWKHPEGEDSDLAGNTSVIYYQPL